MTIMNADEIMKSIPHRYPMLLVDRIIECDDKTRIVGLKNVTVNEPFFTGHFPGAPIMPGVLQLEAMAQTAGLLMNRLSDMAGRIPYFIAVDGARFRKVVMPGDQMRMEIEFLHYRRNIAKFRGKVFVDGALASEAELMCMISDRGVPGNDQHSSNSAGGQQG